MREYEFSNRTVAAFVLVIASALILAAIGFAAGPPLPEFGMSDTNYAKIQLEHDMDAARANIAAERHAQLRAGQNAWARYQVERGK